MVKELQPRSDLPRFLSFRQGPGLYILALIFCLITISAFIGQLDDKASIKRIRLGEVIEMVEVGR